MLPVGTELLPLAASSTNQPGYVGSGEMVGAGMGRVCANFWIWVLRGLYYLETMKMNSGHDSNECVENVVVVH